MAERATIVGYTPYVWTAGFRAYSQYSASLTILGSPQVGDLVVVSTVTMGGSANFAYDSRFLSLTGGFRIWKVASGQQATPISVTVGVGNSSYSAGKVAISVITYRMPSYVDWSKFVTPVYVKTFSGNSQSAPLTGDADYAFTESEIASTYDYAYIPVILYKADAYTQAYTEPSSVSASASIDSSTLIQNEGVSVDFYQEVNTISSRSAENFYLSNEPFSIDSFHSPQMRGDTQSVGASSSYYQIVFSVFRVLPANYVPSVVFAQTRNAFGTLFTSTKDHLFIRRGLGTVEETFSPLFTTPHSLLCTPGGLLIATAADGTRKVSENNGKDWTVVQ